MEKTKKEEFIKLGFFKKIWYSISKFEKYPEMAALGVKKAIIYFTELILIFSVVYVGAYSYYISNIAEFNEDNLSFSQKIVKQLVYDEENEQIKEVAKTIENYSESTIIFSLFISVFISFYIATLVDVFTLSIFGLFTCFVARIKINYKAVFNMSIFALTLSIILRAIYTVITLLTTFKVKYFEIMYISISYISLAAAIFLIKSDVIKQHLELMRVIEESKEKIEQTINMPKRPKEDEKKEEKDDKNEKKENNEGKENEGQGSNA